MLAGDLAAPAVTLAEAQAYVRVETGEEEAILAGLIRTATAMCEQFTGRVLLARDFSETLRCSTVSVTAHGPGDLPAPPSVMRAANGEAMRPLSPGRLTAAFAADGSLGIRWFRRSRLAWAWLDEVDTPPDLSLQGYRLRVASPSTTIDRDSIAEEVILSSAEVAALGAGPFEIQVRQIGTSALSRPATLHLNP